MNQSVSYEMLTATGVCVSLSRVPVLESISFETRPGEVTGLIGPNGSGKTTLLRVLAGLLRPDRGTVSLGETNLKDLSASERARRIAYMPQHDAARPFTALETVLMGRYTHLSRFELEGRRDRRIAREAMIRTDSARFEGRQLDRLSGGERQRVILARAIAQQASIILLDEPSSSLDLRHRLSIMETLRSEAADRFVAIVVALHDISLAARYCDRLALLSAGSIVAEGAPDFVLTPGNLRGVFGVETQVQMDPATGCPQVWLIGTTM
ncbi:MAG: ABC transporter ATP-binding protein [Chloroflexi bacterium]|nr:ABC transporter ATP-binding protein [Chloroflexota bacterium]